MPRVLDANNKIEFKKIDVMSAGKICAALHAILGFIGGVIVASLIGGLLIWMPVVSPATSQLVNIGFMSGVAGLSAIVLFPIAGAIFGFLWGVILAFLYNIVASRIGGIEVSTK